jgi:hypothetical protein
MRERLKAKELQENCKTSLFVDTCEIWERFKIPEKV